MADKKAAVGKYKPNGVWEAGTWDSGDTLVDPDGNPIGIGGSAFSSSYEFTVGSKDAGDTLADCDFLHENGVYDGIIAAMQAIYDFGAGNRFGTIYIRRGHYISQTRYYLSSTNASIQGAGREATKIEHKDTVYESQFQIHNTSIHFKDLTFICQDRAPAYGFMYIASTCRNANFHRCKFVGVSDALGLSIHGLTNDNTVVLEDCIFDFTSGGNRILYASGSETKIHMSRCIFYPRELSTEYIISTYGVHTVTFDQCRFENETTIGNGLMVIENPVRFILKNSYIQGGGTGLAYYINVDYDPSYSGTAIIKNNEFDSYNNSLAIGDTCNAKIHDNTFIISDISKVNKLRFGSFLSVPRYSMVYRNRFYPGSHCRYNGVDYYFTCLSVGAESKVHNNIIEALGDGINQIDNWKGISAEDNCHISKNRIKLTGVGVIRATGIYALYGICIINNNKIKMESDTDYTGWVTIGINFSLNQFYVVKGNNIKITNSGGTGSDKAVAILAQGNKFAVSNNNIKINRSSDTGVLVFGTPSGTIVNNTINPAGTPISNSAPNVIVSNNDIL